MGRYVLARLLQSVPVLLGVAVASFLMLRLVPGDPAIVALGNTATDEQLSAFRESHGLNGPLWTQLVHYLESLAHLDVGRSIFYREPVLDLIGQRLPVTIALLFLSLIFGVLAASVLAGIAAAARGRWADRGVRGVFSVLLSVPNFWLGTILILVFAVRLRWLPTSGAGAAWWSLPHLALPALTLAAGAIPVIGRTLRSSLVEVTRTDYVSLARGLGLSRATIARVFVGRNVARPLVTVTVVNLGWIISGTVVVENVFGLAGVGSLLVQAVTTRDYAVVQGVALVLAVAVVLGNLAADIVISSIDPRVRFTHAH